MIDSKMADGTDEPRSGLKVCVVGSGTKFVSGISYYTYFLASALKQRYDVVAILMRHLIPKRWYPGRQHVGRNVMAYDLATEMPTFDGVDWWGWPSVPRALGFLRAQQPQVLILQWWTASVLFGFSHITNMGFPNWRYVILASLAGLFYGWTWRKTGSIFASALVHAAVDATWHFLFHS